MEKTKKLPLKDKKMLIELTFMLTLLFRKCNSGVTYIINLECCFPYDAYLPPS